MLLLVGGRQLTSPAWWELQNLQNSSKILLCVSFEGKPGPCPKAALLFLFFFFKFNYIYFLGALGLLCSEQRLLLVAVCRLLTAVASLVAEHGL